MPARHLLFHEREGLLNHHQGSENRQSAHASP
jgi:hypothetical protein